MAVSLSSTSPLGYPLPGARIGLRLTPGGCTGPGLPQDGDYQIHRLHPGSSTEHRCAGIPTLNTVGDYILTLDDNKPGSVQPGGLPFVLESCAAIQLIKLPERLPSTPVAPGAVYVPAQLSQ